ncbi:MAG: hypothetical protein C0402_05180 [Thermodesulfovibrio sp.]|nr:hypothetical protein [Thermodesulfovibrio sp.]
MMCARHLIVSFRKWRICGPGQHSPPCSRTNGMIDVTSRDIDIFRCLSSGARKLTDIRDEMKKFAFDSKSNGENALRVLSDATEFSRDMTLEALRIRLKRMRREGFVQSQRYRSRTGADVFALYSLTDLSIDALVENGMEHEHIRTHLPHRYGVVHELMVTDVVRTIKREAGQLFYRFKFKDENVLKTEYRGAGMRYPDLMVTLFPDGDASKKVVAIEIDNGTISLKRVVEKAVGLFELFKVPSMILCRTARRISNMQNEFRQTFPNKDDVMAVKIFFALIQDFTHKGFVETRWLTMWDEQAAVVRLNKKKR